MKSNLAIALAFLTGCLSALAQPTPDSVFIRPHYKNGSSPLKLDYSVDGKHWDLIDYTIFSSDYGPWGSEKKLYDVVLRYDGKRYSAEFIPSPKNPQIGVTESCDLVLWKPQDYPRLSPTAFAAKQKELQTASKSCVLKVPFRDVKGLMQRAQAAAANAKNEQENIIQSGAGLNKAAKSFRTNITVDFNDQKDISPLLYGVFFEDISYAADGGLYAELLQNRDFEYSAADHGGWNSQTAWSFEGDGSWEVKTQAPIHKNNPHYITLTTNAVGTRLINHGWNGIAVKAKARYDLSAFIKGSGKVRVSIVDNGTVLASTTLSAKKEWRQSKAVLTPSASADKAQLVIEPLQKGWLDIDFVSLFPQDTYKGRKNGLRKDLAELIADLHPRFVRFPGGCASHGQGIDNIYHWQATVGELWERQPDMNIWNYHQSRGLGFYEYFLYCEDMGAEPLPVLAAGVPCQNSHRGGNGQQGGIPFERDLKGQPSPYTYNGKPLTMESYLQELLDLIEWANGDAKTSKLAQIRAKAGHPKPFNLKYLGIGNEDLISDTFMERYLFLINGIKAVHPEITIVGTVGPFWEGSDYEYGWQAARKNNIEIVDEHYYNTPGWYFHHQDFYDRYDRKSTKVYLGEWASKGNRVTNALVEAMYMTNVERNADVVVMSSYAPLLCHYDHRNWSPDMIFFNETKADPTANYYVHRAFGQNAGDKYIYSRLHADIVSDDKRAGRGDLDLRVRNSVVMDSKTGDIIIKVVSLVGKDNELTIDLGDSIDLSKYKKDAKMLLLSQPEDPNKANQWSENTTKTITTGKTFNVTLPAYSFAIIRITK